MTVFHHHGQRQLYTPREAVTPYGINQTLKYLLAAARSLDDATTSQQGKIWTTQRYATPSGAVARTPTYREWWPIGYPVLRLAEAETMRMSHKRLMGQVEENEQGRMHWDHCPKSYDQEEAVHRYRRYLQSPLEEVSDPEHWQYLHHDSSTSGSDPERSFDSPRRGEGGEEESMDSLQK